MRTLQPAYGVWFRVCKYKDMISARIFRQQECVAPMVSLRDKEALQLKMQVPGPSDQSQFLAPLCLSSGHSGKLLSFPVPQLIIAALTQIDSCVNGAGTPERIWKQLDICKCDLFYGCLIHWDFWSFQCSILFSCVIFYSKVYKFYTHENGVIFNPFL